MKVFFLMNRRGNKKGVLNKYIVLLIRGTFWLHSLTIFKEQGNKFFIIKLFNKSTNNSRRLKGKEISTGKYKKTFLIVKETLKTTVSLYLL